MTVTELLKTVRRVELRNNRLVNDTMVGAYLSHFKGRGMDFAEHSLLSRSAQHSANSSVAFESNQR
jgi:hypothetical protein